MYLIKSAKKYCKNSKRTHFICPPFLSQDFAGMYANHKKYIKTVANKKKDVKICDTNPIHWTINNRSRLQGIFT